MHRHGSRGALFLAVTVTEGGESRYRILFPDAVVVDCDCHEGEKWANTVRRDLLADRFAASIDHALSNGGAA